MLLNFRDSYSKVFGKNIPIVVYIKKKCTCLGRSKLDHITRFSWHVICQTTAVEHVLFKSILSQPSFEHKVNSMCYLYVFSAVKTYFQNKVLVSVCGIERDEQPFDPRSILWKRWTSILGFNQCLYFNYVILCMILPRDRVGLAAMKEIPLY